MSTLARHANVSPSEFEGMEYRETLRLLDAVEDELAAEDKLAATRHKQLIQALGARLV